MVYTLKIKDGMAVSRHYFTTELAAMTAAKAMLQAPRIKVVVFEGARLEGKVLYREESKLTREDLMAALDRYNNA